MILPLTALTQTEYDILMFLSMHRHTHYPNPSVIGYQCMKLHKPNASPQGMALAVGKHLRSLHKKGMIHPYNGWKITQAGMDAVASTTEKVS